MKKIVSTCNRLGSCNYLSSLVVNKVRFVIFTLHRVSVTQELMFAVSYTDVNLFNWPDAIFLYLSGPRLHSHGCDCILACSCPFQKASREKGCIHTGAWKKSVN